MPLNGSNVSQSSYLPYVLGSPQATRRTAVTANYTVVATDTTVAYTALSAAMIVTLPNGQQAGRCIIIKDESGGCSSTNTITALGTIDGQSSLILSTAYKSVRLYSNGVSWSRIS